MIKLFDVDRSLLYAIRKTAEALGHCPVREAYTSDAAYEAAKAAFLTQKKYCMEFSLTSGAPTDAMEFKTPQVSVWRQRTNIMANAYGLYEWYQLQAPDPNSGSWIKVTYSDIYNVTYWVYLLYSNYDHRNHLEQVIEEALRPLGSVVLYTIAPDDTKTKYGEKWIDREPVSIMYGSDAVGVCASKVTIHSVQTHLPRYYTGEVWSYNIADAKIYPRVEDTTQLPTT